MSERKEEEEMAEQGSPSGSSEGEEQLVDAEIHEESPQMEENEDPSGNSEYTHSDEGDKNVEIAVEEAKLNGEVKLSPKPTVDGISNADDVEGEGKATASECDATEIQTEIVAGASEGVLDLKEEYANVEKSKDVDESKMEEVSKQVEELKYVEESKEVEEPMEVEESKKTEELKKVEELKETEDLKNVEHVKNEVKAEAVHHARTENGVKEETPMKRESTMVPYTANTEVSNQSYSAAPFMDGDDSGTDEEISSFTKELENFFREKGLEFKHPKFYGEGLNCLKLWRAVTKLGGYDRVTACKLWRQVGESFKPPKTCTTVSWSFRIFYEKALLDYERHKTRGGELQIAASPLPEPLNVQHPLGHQGSGSGRARRDAANRAMQGWHSQRLLGNGEVGDPIIKDKNAISLQKREKQLKNIGLLKRKKPSSLDRSAKAARTLTKVPKPQIEADVADVGPPADWVKINVQRTKDCFEVYALVPGLLREEVRVQSDPAGRLVISGEPEQPDNPWGVTPFQKVISLPSRIDPHQTSAVVTLHGQLFVRVPFEQADL